MSKVRIAIIGNGMVGHRFIEELLDKTPAKQFDIAVFCEEPRIAYDRVHLPSYFSHHTAEELSLVREGFYEKHGIKMLVGEQAITINRQEKVIHSGAGHTVFYNKLIMTTGSYPQIPPTRDAETQDCFVYRTVEDLNVIESCARHSKHGAVVGGGLPGLEAAGALKNLGAEIHVIEFAPMLMVEQLNQMGGEQLRHKIEGMGVKIHTNRNAKEIVQQSTEVRRTMHSADGSGLQVDFIVFSTRIRPRNKLAAQCGPVVAQRDGIMVNDNCQTSGPNIYATGECASWNNRVYGLIVPGCKMARVAVDHLLGSENGFTGAGLSAKLKLLGVDVDGIDDAHDRTPDARSYVYLDESKEICKHLIVSVGNRTLLGTVPVGDTSDYDSLLQLVLNAIELPENPDSLILPAHAGSGKPSIGVDKLSDSAQIYSCFDASKGDLIAAINKGCHTVAALRAETKAEAGCGGCIPLVTQVPNAELAKQGIEVNNNLCEHSAYSRQGLFHPIHVEDIKTFDELLEKHGQGCGYEICKPTVGSLLASCWNRYILKSQHTPLQDTNDNFLANVQEDSIYSMTPRSAGGEITPERLAAVGRITRELNLYTRIAGSQHIGLFGVQENDLPEIWHQLIEAGFEASHAYAKALRMTKTCVGNTWCRCGVGGSVGFSVGLKNRYKGIRTSHKMKFSVSGCTRECTETQGKDVGTVATEKGWNLYVCGNGGMKPRRADLLAADLDRETLIKYPDHFMMFYIRTADRLTRTAPWLDNMKGGIDYLRSVIIDDKLGLNNHLEEELARLRAAFACEWAETVNNPVAQTHFKHFINSDQRGLDIQVIPEHDQHHPATPYERIPVALVEENVWANG